jgi:seryl-tRNA synthetase
MSSADTEAFDIDIWLPSPSGYGKTGSVIVCRKASSNNQMRVNASVSSYVHGTNSVALGRLNNSLSFISDGVSNWWIK